MAALAIGFAVLGGPRIEQRVGMRAGEIALGEPVDGEVVLDTATGRVEPGDSLSWTTSPRPEIGDPRLAPGSRLTATLSPAASTGVRGGVALTLLGPDGAVVATERFEAPGETGPRGEELYAGGVIATGKALSVGAVTVSDPTASWTPDALVGYQIEIAPDGIRGETRTIVANTATEITVSPAWEQYPSYGTGYTIFVGRTAATPQAPEESTMTATLDEVGAYRLQVDAPTGYVWEIAPDNVEAGSLLLETTATRELIPADTGQGRIAGGVWLVAGASLLAASTRRRPGGLDLVAAGALVAAGLAVPLVIPTCTYEWFFLAESGELGSEYGRLVEHGMDNQVLLLTSYAAVFAGGLWLGGRVGAGIGGAGCLAVLGWIAILGGGLLAFTSLFGPPGPVPSVPCEERSGDYMMYGLWLGVPAAAAAALGLGAFLTVGSLRGTRTSHATEDDLDEDYAAGSRPGRDAGTP